MFDFDHFGCIFDEIDYSCSEGFDVVRQGSTIGQVTSGTFSPTLDRPIAMAYVDTDHSAIGTAVNVDIRGKLEPATIVKLPFYRRST